jgi:hypothetical protein
MKHLLDRDWHEAFMRKPHPTGSDISTHRHGYVVSGYVCGAGLKGIPVIFEAVDPTPTVAVKYDRSRLEEVRDIPWLPQ